MELVDKNGELEKAQDELINSERMSTVGKMVSIIIHDFKSPMQVIKGMTQLISMGNIDEEKRNDLIAYINKAIDQMNNMTHDILDFIRGRKNLNFKTVKLSKVINELLAYMSNDLQNNNFQVTRTVDFDPEMTIDLFKIKRVFENLVRNAIEASEGENSIDIASEKYNGAEIKDSLFEPFITKGKSQGTGLGLAIKTG